MVERVKKILEHYEEADIVIEGHYHQARMIDNYISLPSLAGQEQAAIVQNSKIVFTTL